jgi:ribosomal protein L11 methyltransferase
MTFAKIIFSDISDSEKEMLVAMLSASGMEGFEETDTQLTAYVSRQHFDETSVNNIAQTLKLNYSVDDVPDKNWNEEWEANFSPVVVENYCAVRAGFHEPITNVTHEIIITPKMSFGTGHHSTTFMMIAEMKEIEFENKKVLDFGTGTGVLAILAAKSGAAQITAIDNDDWSITNAAENFQTNHCENIKLLKREDADVNGSFDVILANIIRTVIIDNFPYFDSHLSSRGVLLLSGLLKEDELEVTTKASEYGLTLLHKSEKGQWICLKFMR